MINTRLLRRTRLVLTGLAMALVVTQPGQVSASTEGGANGGIFGSVCEYTGATLPDDPIKFPGQPGASHMHDFLGQTADANATYDTLRTGTTICHNQLDLAAYWIPTMFTDASMTTAIHPSNAVAYYRGRKKPFSETIPQGLMMIAGNAMATDPSQAENIKWGCSGTPVKYPEAISCPGADTTVRIYFADCWNGTDLDSPDHVSHVAYSDKGGNCPEGYPVPMPGLEVFVRYQTQNADTASLSSGGTYSMHSDFINAWDPAELQHQIDICVNANKRCIHD